MGAAASNRGARVIAAQIDRELEARRTRREVCGGACHNGPGKAFARCSRCEAIDYEKYEGDRCGREILVVRR